MLENKSYQGSCLCGQVSYQVDEPLKMFQYCHCSRCRKITGSGFAPNIFVPLEQFKWLTGEHLLGRYEVREAKYFATSFCQHCGSTMPWLTQTGQLYVLPVGTLDDEISLKPSQNIYCDEIPNWHQSFSELPKFAQGPKK
ncbi:GFA family protein [Thalassotalea sp. ND16A]|uniref:GFA family protein n=1 Tax=Thalassotalea sp. ND16A TaxID=1535422 RepID=UPI00051A5E40|nr:GFA family protein [Thalassotalea sp. ND16A]KGK00183.1 hypothetical protein ND16A_3654 [Thalassotalea sp. ND16A]